MQGDDVKTETLTIPAKDVKAGDVTPWGKAEIDAYACGEYAAFYSFRVDGAAITPTNQVAVTVSRATEEIERGRP